MAMNSIRMIPFFIPADQIDNKIQDMINLVFPNNYTLYTNPKVLQIDQMQTKFVSNMEQIVVWNLMGNLIVSSFVTSSKWAFFVLLMAGGSRISTN